MGTAFINSGWGEKILEDLCGDDADCRAENSDIYGAGTNVGLIMAIAWVETKYATDFSKRSDADGKYNVFNATIDGKSGGGLVVYSNWRKSVTLQGKYLIDQYLRNNPESLEGNKQISRIADIRGEDQEWIDSVITEMEQIYKEIPDLFNIKTLEKPAIAGKIQLLKQCDPQWASEPYDNNGECSGSPTICSSGCGPTSLAMVIKFYGYDVTPIEIASKIEAEGLRVCGSGTAPAAMVKIPESYGLTSIQTSDWSLIDEALGKNIPVIARMGPGIFTNEGHYVVFTGFSFDGLVLVNDPDGKHVTSAPVQTVQEQVKNPGFWIIKR